MSSHSFCGTPSLLNTSFATSLGSGGFPNNGIAFSYVADLFPISPMPMTCLFPIPTIITRGTSAFVCMNSDFFWYDFLNEKSFTSYYIYRKVFNFFLPHFIG